MQAEVSEQWQSSPSSPKVCLQPQCWLCCSLQLMHSSTPCPAQLARFGILLLPELAQGLPVCSQDTEISLGLRSQAGDQ